ncbi:hypothetical protein EGW08_013575 [Elysia chlorotica]|uniref:VWFC domain-containing protein n=1 Tax=Elysia chlorotica TaxID=188477 RepID=A0A3S1BZ23_ELYCH|nr:hypothetical protein EGW08_013575 [Elysia chlorotica]
MNVKAMKHRRKLFTEKDERSSSRRREVPLCQRVALAFVLVCCWIQPCLSVALSGKEVACTNEGEEVEVPLVETYPCFKCYCRAGVVTVTEEVCRAPCENATHIPGQCCPSCAGCNFNGRNYMSGEIFALRDEPDVECKCLVNSVTCSSRACPVLNCPVWSRHKLPGHRCPTCKGQRTIFNTPGSCYLAQQVYSHGDSHRPDNCTACQCQRGTMVCEREQCQKLDCPDSEQVLQPGSCCPVCPNRKPCDAEGRSAKHGETWRKDNCETCTCSNGAWQCSQPECPALTCPEGYIKRTVEDSCCPKCIKLKEYASCVVRGKSSDQIRTFAGLSYQTQGYCLHDLVTDCSRRDFSVKLRYDRPGGAAGRTSHNATQQPGEADATRLYQLYMISIRFGSANVKVFRNGKLRVNRVKGALGGGRRKRGGAKAGRSSVERRGGGKGKKRTVEDEGADAAFIKQMYFSMRAGKISVRLERLGVLLTWDVRRNKLKVKVKVERYMGQRRLCGLCGSVGDGRDVSGAARITRNKRFEPVLPSHMAWEWRRGHACRERDREARQDLERHATSGSSSLSAEITSLLNSLGASRSSKTSSQGLPYATLTHGPKDETYRTDQVVIKPLNN